MMRILQVNSVGGASGDMLLGALIDLGASADDIQTALTGLHIDAFNIETEKASENGLHGTRARVVLAEKEGHHHRHLSDIRTIIDDSSLPDDVKAESIAVFTRLAEAEAAVHNTTPEKIHFHEVGAMDSIIDIIGCCLAKQMLNIDAVALDALPTGCGTVECEHGTMPVPVPATVEMLKGMKTIPTGEPFELVTPTGAALLSTWTSMTTPPPGSSIVHNGIGFGQRKLNNRPNLVRLLILEQAENEENNTDCLVIECNLDDTIPEIIAAAQQRLLKAGALDVFTTSVHMKKQRPGSKLTVLATPNDRDKLLDIIFRETTTFGVREYMTRRTMLDRRFDTVETEYGDVRIKVGTRNGEVVSVSPEYDDCLKQAESCNTAVRTIYEAALGAWRHKNA